MHVTIAEHGRELILEVTDDGDGFDPDAVGTGTGLRNMRDRVASLGGSLTIEAASSHGTRVSGVIPVGTPTRASASPE